MIKETFSIFPDYLFARLGMATYSAKNGDFEKVREMLGPEMYLKSLYPNRSKFHVSEVVNYYQATISYFCALGNFKEAEKRLEILEHIDRDSEETQFAKSQIMLKRLTKIFETEKKAHKREPKFIDKQTVFPSDEEPIFENALINELYRNSMRIDHGIIKEILSLPRQTLIRDLNKVVYDSMARFEYFNSLDWNNDTHEFLLHAIFILTEIRAEESLETLLDVLRQDEYYFDYWFDDFLTEDFWKCIFKIGENRLNDLKRYMREAGNFTYARSAVSSAVEQIGLYYPERKQEVSDWYRDIFEYFISNKDDDSIIDVGLIGLMLGDVSHLAIVELAPIVHFLYENNLVDCSVIGEDEIFKFKRNDYRDKREIGSSIFDKYNLAISSWPAYKEEELPGSYANDFEPFWDDDDEVEQRTLQSPKVGRNDPCFCGSGKKYKKCCGK